MKRLLCCFGLHRYVLVCRLSEWSMLVGCETCQRLYAVRPDLEMVVRWSLDAERMWPRIRTDPEAATVPPVQDQ